MAVNSHNTDLCRPFLKWAGNKFRIMNQIHKLLPADGKRLIEPFAGSAAVFLNTNYARYLVCDTNPDLINLYNTLKKEGPDFIRYCKRYFTEKNNSAEKYYYYREQFNQTSDIRKRSALFVYLNRHGYNGLCRYNASGGFNVPFGRYQRPYFPEKEMLFFHRKAKRASFKVASFENIMRKARQGDVIYCDPPYVPLSL
ncbi:MAG: Dam family site-specific DNA-(adenine-N6)-methyltransferase, partial [Thioalkalispiraceae bacterium]